MMTRAVRAVNAAGGYTASAYCRALVKDLSLTEEQCYPLCLRGAQEDCGAIVAPKEYYFGFNTPYGRTRSLEGLTVQGKLLENESGRSVA